MKDNPIIKAMQKIYSNRVRSTRNYEYLIIGNWNGGGACPWQMHLPIWYNDTRYTIYLRERHDIISCKIFKGKVSMTYFEEGATIVTDDLFADIDLDKIPSCISLELFAENLVNEYIMCGGLEQQ